MEALKKRYLRKSRRNAVICLLIAIILGAVLFKDWLPIGETLDLDYVKTADEIHEGRAKITVAYIWDYFMYYTDGYSSSEENASERDYFVMCGIGLDENDVDTSVYVGAHLAGNNNKRAYALLEELWGEEEPDWDNLDMFTVKGHLRKLDFEQQEGWDAYMQDFLDYGFTQEEIDESFVAYMFEPNKITSLGSTDVIGYIGAFFAVLMLAMGLGNLVQGLFGNPLKAIEKYGVKHNGEDAAMQKAQMLFDRNIPKYGMIGDDEMFIYDDGHALMVEDPKDILWAYENVVTRKSGVVTVGKDYSMVIRLANGKQISIAAKQGEIQSMLRAFHEICPDAIVGFNNDINRDFIRNRQAVIAEVARRRQVRIGNTYGSFATEGAEMTETANTVSMPADDGLTSGDIFGDSMTADTQTTATDAVTIPADTDTTDNDKLGGFFS